ncbi:hypothetical protein [Fimbriiglobus ruber]|uniref:hypothetical protein n=1 Tax=Fimbriiglobus ruber TaxID=1908690 RepID=UPI00117BD983|nr:hypothetical protein [Fimbriiglobus ruber]
MRKTFLVAGLLASLFFVMVVVDRVIADDPGGNPALTWTLDNTTSSYPTNPSVCGPAGGAAHA